MFGEDLDGEELDVVEWVRDEMRTLFSEAVSDSLFQARQLAQQMAVYNAISGPDEGWGDLLMPYAARDVRLTAQLHERVDTEEFENQWRAANPSMRGLRPSLVVYDEGTDTIDFRCTGISIPYHVDYREVEFVPTPPEITPQIARHMSTIATNSAYGSTPVTERRRDYRGSRG